MKIGYLETAPGNKSVTRLIFLLGIVWAIAFTTVFAILTKLGVGEIVALFGGLSGPFFALKLIQKPMEEKEPITPKDDKGISDNS
jgi:hypothetical protein